jgi:Ion channel
MGRLVVLISGLLPLAAMTIVEPWAVAEFLLDHVRRRYGRRLAVRTISLYKLVGPPAHYRGLATRNWGRGATFVLFLSTVFLITFTFATFYWALSGRSVSAFTEPLSRIDAVYFALTVFTTTGFGDIRATSDLARFAVTLQMFFGFAFVIGAIGAALQDRHHVPQTRRQRNSPDRTR